MYIMRKARKYLKAQRNHVDIKKTKELSDYFRKKVMNVEVLKLLGGKNFENLTNVALYVDYGVWTSIQTAFCFGYKAGREQLKEEIKTHFSKWLDHDGKDGDSL